MLDYFKLDAVDWLGASCGGYLSIRAAAFEPRIKHIISLPTTYSGLDMTLKQMAPGKAQQLISLFKAGDRQGTEALVAEQRTPNSVFDWCITQGMHITGTRTPFDFLTAIAPALARRHSAQRQAGYPADGRRAGPSFQR